MYKNVKPGYLPAGLINKLLESYKAFSFSSAACKAR
jgi:hypothetical protein